MSIWWCQGFLVETQQCCGNKELVVPTNRSSVMIGIPECDQDRLCVVPETICVKTTTVTLVATINTYVTSKAYEPTDDMARPTTGVHVE